MGCFLVHNVSILFLSLCIFVLDSNGYRWTMSLMTWKQPSLSPNPSHSPNPSPSPYPLPPQPISLSNPSPSPKPSPIPTGVVQFCFRNKCLICLETTTECTRWFPWWCGNAMKTLKTCIFGHFFWCGYLLDNPIHPSQLDWLMTEYSYNSEILALAARMFLSTHAAQSCNSFTRFATSHLFHLLCAFFGNDISWCMDASVTRMGGLVMTMGDKCETTTKGEVAVTAEDKFATA